MLEDFKTLKRLSMKDNPFERDEQIFLKVVKYLPKTLKWFNEQQVSYWKKTVAPPKQPPQMPTLE